MRGATINKLKKNASAYEVSAGKLCKTILSGRVLAVDPSSGSKDSMPGIALYENGSITDSRILLLNYKQSVQQRLNKLFYLIDEIGHIDVMIIERIRGAQAHAYLHWAVGTTIAACRADHVLEIPTTTWKKYARTIEDYSKSDVNDALMMLMATLRIAQDAINTPKAKRKRRNK
jgi:hypothetical protein